MCGWNSGQSAVSQYLGGKLALNLEALIKLSEVLDFEPEDVSPTLGRGVTRKKDSTGQGKNKSVDLSNEEEDGADNYAFIPQYTAMAAAGAGHDNPHVEIRSTLAFKKEWLASKGLQPRNLRVIYADGESMWPTINDQDVLLVDSSQVEPVDNGVFVIESGADGTLVKRLVRAPLQQWILLSDNTDKAAYPDRFYLRSESNEHQIVGRVIWRGGDL
ncbi:CI repressor protein [Pseudomonas syringae pv. tomato]|uniref:CI repressor protein n=1 Tax=Pseudomonas syringae pv. tomato TaxID=323 RepID=A0AAQ0NDZ9_PSEUB|nr:putative HTH-type transcriptional regulator [Pseudomonas syringae pv. tomato]KUR48068.1 putative HTH-type transcriptional regulator [Pseudomonas syringae pv. tomato]RMQ79178.1 CI repressor protein [Pseudomonas syringae pv. tomato]CAI8908544.1 CI repressor protein [Pseudomonas syringae pv. tomato]